jgi:signal transduction histidine kinase
MATATAELQANGWAPRWWRDGVRTPLWWAAAILAPGLLVASAITAYEHGFPPALCALRAAALTAEVTVGLLFWMWRPRNIIGPLLVTYPVLFFVFEDLVHWFPHSRLAVTLLFFNVLWWPLFALMLFVFPTGRIWNAWARGAWLCVWVMALTFFPPFLLFVPAGIPMDYGVTQVPSYFYVGHGWSGLERWVQAWWIAECAVFLLVSTVLIARVVGASPGARRRLVPLFAVFIVIDTFKDIYILVHVLNGEPYFEGWFKYVWYVPLCLSAAAAAFGLGMVRRARSSVSDLVVELGEIEPGHVRAALARTLGDPSLVLGLWLPDGSMWADEDGREIDLPTDDSRAVTYVGDRLAVLVHDPDLLDQPRLLESVGAAGRLALENERLQAQLRAQLAELRESRARIVKAGDRERRRLERDLHDGAQQRLLALGMGLQLLEAHLDEPGKSVLAENEAELQEALAELRDLARGIHPAVLTDQGLDAAVRSIAERSPVPVTITGTAGPLPGELETAAYFVVSEALTNIGKYANASEATIRIGRDNGALALTIEDDGIGGADPANGSGLHGLADRVHALDGQLEVASPPGRGTRVEARIPCASTLTPSRPG